MRAERPCVAYTHPHPNPPGLRCRCPGFCKHCGFTEAEHNAYHFGSLARSDKPSVQQLLDIGNAILDGVPEPQPRRQGMTREQFDEVMDTLVHKGMLVLNPDGTYSPTPSGRAVVDAHQPGKQN